MCIVRATLHFTNQFPQTVLETYSFPSWIPKENSPKTYKFLGMMLALALCCLLLGAVCGSRFRSGYYEEVRTLGGSCFPRDTCAFLNNSTEDHLWGDRTCECGDHCVRHGTCCVDSRYSGIEYRSSAHLQETCQKVQNNVITVTMVSQCPSAWQKSYVNGRCVGPEGGLEDPLSTVPVTSLTTRTTYRNYFCALCNDDANSILMWDIEAKLNLVDDTSNSVSASAEVMERLEYNIEKGSWGVQYVDAETNDQQFRKIKLKFALPAGLKKMVKQCHPRMVSDCGSSLRSSSLRQRCLAYYSPIRARKDGSSVFVDYRNIHCALCNGLRVRPNNVACPKIRSIKKDRPSLTLTVLFDINTEGGGSVCKEGQVHDPFFKKCRSLVCAMPNYVIKNGACVKSE
ncbi:uncharacterized protein CDAR_479381 [Caerostris darwini]|uniref:SMB domain-containing protein n=1 Tax=Caerostris darwini TaxID=1538125 RepID=A0AAV4MSW7_9ARAC|nr:uncharacterized protein CDAR_479381 [Caerostris darwini]